MSPMTDHYDAGGVLSSPVAEYGAEFRAYEDDAWYAVRVSLRERALRINYVNFDYVRDNFFEPKDFKRLKELEEFIRRFRPLSLQLQDHECSTVFQGMRVCASHSFSLDDVSFYDGSIEKVEHCNRSGDEECSCRFMILWEHGPNAGNLTKSRIESICKIQNRKELNPAISVFFKIVSERINCSTGPNSISKLSFWEHLKQGKRCAKRSKCKVRASEGSSSGHLRSKNQDVDVGGVLSKHTILLENVDKGLSASTISEFLQRQTSVLPQVYICPSLPWEMYTRALVILDCESKLKRMTDFLENPNHFVISSTGRPLVIVEKLAGLDTVKESAHALIPVSNLGQQKSFFSGSGKELKVVSSRSVDYRRAKRLRDLFNEFSAQQRRLHQRLAVEEGSVLFN